ncbi:MAG: phosphoribosylanthranilate isomerase [Planctomycetes bacterium]|nr:phosphoribosylanthranilate isomerase [Planctomycetota bacterium]
MWVKICGIRDEVTADQVCRLAPDAIGLNFYSKSPRCVARDVAVRIAAISGERIQRVGVFVNQTVDEIEDLVIACRLTAVQLHGDETASQVAEVVGRLPGLPLYRAWRMAGDSVDDLAIHLRDCRSLGVIPAGCLIDSRVQGAFGGTGHAVPWDALARSYDPGWPAMILAGGLTPENVASAIRIVRPWGVDVASGVEAAPGVKDLDLVRQFIEHARTTSAG